MREILNEKGTDRLNILLESEEFGDKLAEVMVDFKEIKGRLDLIEQKAVYDKECDLVKATCLRDASEFQGILCIKGIKFSETDPVKLMDIIKDQFGLKADIEVD